LNGTSCERTLSEAVVYYCDTNWQSLNTSQCRFDSPNLTVGNCLVGYKLNTANGNCEKSTSQEVAYSCSAGEEWTLNKPNCDFYDEEPLIINCPTGYEQGVGTTCEKALIEPASFECPDMYWPDANKEQCVKETRVPHLF